MAVAVAASTNAVCFVKWLLFLLVVAAAATTSSIIVSVAASAGWEVVFLECANLCAQRIQVALFFRPFGKQCLSQFPSGFDTTHAVVTGLAAAAVSVAAAVSSAGCCCLCCCFGSFRVAVSLWNLRPSFVQRYLTFHPF